MRVESGKLRRVGKNGLALGVGVVIALAISNGVRSTSDSSSQLTEAEPTTRLLGGLAGEKPNILVVTLDTTRADRLGSYGSAVETPHLDSVATRGIRFVHAISSAPVTLPSHSSIFTGLDPHRHGVRENGSYVLDRAQLTLAEIVQSRGWRTGAFIGGFPLSARFGLDQGFDHYDDDLAAGNTGPPREDLWQGMARPYVDRPAGPVVESAMSWIGANADAPFFAWVHLFDAHSAYRPPEPFATRYRGHRYDGEVAYMDSALGELFDALERWRIERKTLVIIAADHGESLGEHDVRGHGRELYEASLHVPLILAFPGRIRAGQVVEESVRNVDLLPTVLELLGLPLPPKLDGQSLVGLLRGESRPARGDAYAETLMPKLRFGGPERYALYRGRWKLIREVAPDGTKTERLYDLAEDPSELRNRAPDEEAVREALDEALDARIARGITATDSSPLDAETEAALRELGYIL